MKLGVNSYFLHFLEFEEGLPFGKEHGGVDLIRED